MHPVGRFSLCAHVLYGGGRGRRATETAVKPQEDAALVQESRERERKERKTETRFIIDEE